MNHSKWLLNWEMPDEVKERKVIVIWEAIYDIVDITLRYLSGMHTISKGKYYTMLSLALQ